LEIDLKTGMTTNVSMIQSSGFPKLDDVAFNTVRRWRLRPGKWREIEVPVVFTMSPLRPGEHFVRHGPPPRQNSRMAVFWERAFLRAFTITMAKSFGSISANESEPDWHLVDTSIKQMR